MKNSILYLVLVFAFTACTLEGGDSDDNNDEEDEVEELSEFGELLAEEFDLQELPYECNRNFDNYDPEDYLDEEEFRMLELYYIFADGYEDDRYSAEDRIELESGIKIAVVTSKDNNQEMSTYLVTYNEDEYYVSNLRVGYEHTLIDLTISSVIYEDKVTRKVIEEYDGEKIVEEETYFIQGDGDIVWEEDIIGDEL